jgi:bifunctional non-homologous end joining protein LigD
MDSMPSTRTSTPPFTITPMQPTQVARPFHVEGFVYEEKVDGYRMAAYKHDGAVRLISRQGIDHINRFRDLATAIATLPYEDVILEGEVAMFDEQLVSRFEWLWRWPRGRETAGPVSLPFPR